MVVRLAGCLVAWLVCFFLSAAWFGWLVGWLAWLNPPTPGPKPRGPHRKGSGRGPKINHHNIVLCFVETIVKDSALEPHASKGGFAFADA